MYSIISKTMYTWSRILVSWEVGLQELNEWLESQVRIKWPAPLLMRKPLVLLRGLAGSILALIKMIIAVVLREKCSTTGKGQFKCCGQEFPTELFLWYQLIRRQREVDQTDLSRYKI